MEHFEKISLDTADYKPAKRPRYVDDNYEVWPHGPAKLQQFSDHINSIRPIIKFTMDVEANNLPFLDVLIMKRSPKLTVKGYRKPIHTGMNTIASETLYSFQKPFHEFFPCGSTANFGP
jgi:hypothetical protein